MDSQDSSGPPPHHPHPHHPLYHHPPPPHMAQQQHIQSPPNNNSSNSYALHNPNNSSIAHQQQQQQQQQNPRFNFNSAAGAAPAPKLLDQQQHFSDGSPSGIEPTRKKRGRPRKYSPDSSIGLGLSPAPANQISPAVGNADSGGGTQSAETGAKRNRGRPPGSGKKQLDALGAPGVGFTPHVILVSSGEDIASKIMSFSQQGQRTVCILSANGAVSNVTLHQPASGGTVTYEGRFEIISLSGSLLPSESSRSGGLSVLLAGSDGRVLGGGVGGVLKAASPVQIVVGSFIADGKKPKSVGLSSPPLPQAPPPPQAPPHMLNFGGVPMAADSPASPGDSSDPSDENDDSPPPPNHYTPNPNMQQMYPNMGWPNSVKMHPN